MDIEGTAVVLIIMRLSVADIKNGNDDNDDDGNNDNNNFVTSSGIKVSPV